MPLTCNKVDIHTFILSCTIDPKVFDSRGTNLYLELLNRIIDNRELFCYDKDES